MVRDLDFDSPVRRGLDRQRLTSSPIDSCFDREWTARDLEIEDSIAGDGADLRAVDEDLVSPEPICESRAANTPEPGGSACGHRGPPRSPGRASLLWTSSSLVASSSGRRRPSARPAARLFSWPSTAPQLKSAGIPTRRLRASCAFIATATRNSRWAGTLARRRSGRRKRQPRSAPRPQPASQRLHFAPATAKEPTQRDVIPIVRKLLRGRDAVPTIRRGPAREDRIIPVGGLI